MSIVIGIDGSRNRSGGAIDHLVNILREGNPLFNGIREVHLWSYKELLDLIPDISWLVKHNPSEMEGSLFKQVWWQLHSLPRELRETKCNILFATDAGTVCRFHPMVVMSQDLLSYEPGVMRYFGFTLARLRLVLLYYIQNRSMRHAEGVIFLTGYVANLVQQVTGRLDKTTVIPHGIDNAFKKQKVTKPWPANREEAIRCVYVSNTEMYKHQWVVVKAIAMLRLKGHNIELALIGGGTGHAQCKLEDTILKIDPGATFIKQVGHVGRLELPKLLADAHVYIFASSCETISITLMEGMAVGLPVACSDRGPMPEVLEDGGVYFDPEDEKSIADAVERIIKEPILRKEIAKRAKELSEQYSWKRCSDETFEFIANTCRSLERA